VEASVLDGPCQEKAAAFDTAKHIEGESPTPDQVKANKAKWGLN
jgi:hypothetical protein